MEMLHIYALNALSKLKIQVLVSVTDNLNKCFKVKK